MEPFHKAGAPLSELFTAMEDHHLEQLGDPALVDPGELCIAFLRDQRGPQRIGTFLGRGDNGFCLERDPAAVLLLNLDVYTLDGGGPTFGRDDPRHIYFTIDNISP